MVKYTTGQNPNTIKKKKSNDMYKFLQATDSFPFYYIINIAQKKYIPASAQQVARKSISNSKH